MRESQERMNESLDAYGALVPTRSTFSISVFHWRNFITKLLEVRFEFELLEVEDSGVDLQRFMDWYDLDEEDLHP